MSLNEQGFINEKIFSCDFWFPEKLGCYTPPRRATAHSLSCHRSQLPAPCPPHRIAVCHAATPSSCCRAHLATVPPCHCPAAAPSVGCAGHRGRGYCDGGCNEYRCIRTEEMHFFHFGLDYIFIITYEAILELELYQMLCLKLRSSLLGSATLL
jgi:hypothetical protein